MTEDDRGWILNLDLLMAEILQYQNISRRSIQLHIAWAQA